MHHVKENVADITKFSRRYFKTTQIPNWLHENVHRHFDFFFSLTLHTSIMTVQVVNTFANGINPSSLLKASTTHANGY